MASAAGSMRKLLNWPEQVVTESLAGLAAAHGDLLRYEPASRIVVRVDAPLPGKVALVSGGGSGHEPLHAGYVGRGMLDAACPGEVFTSPVPDQVLAATRAVHGGAGVVHVVKNYTGDVLNFRLAAEEAADGGIEVAAVLIDDDVAVRDSLYTAGRRGAGATVLAEKIAGAAADRGHDLAAVAGFARRVNQRARSFGVALSSCVPPAAGRPIFDLPEGQMEVGIGIHGEPGRRRAPLGTAGEIAGLLVGAVLEDLAPRPGAEVLAFVNGMGGTPRARAVPALRRGRAPAPRGGSPLCPEPGGELHHLARDGRRRADGAGAGRRADGPLGRPGAHPRPPLGRLRYPVSAVVERAMDAGTIATWMALSDAAFRAERDHLGQLDAAVGDGDHGTTMARGFAAVVRALAAEAGAPPGRLLTLAGQTLVSTMGGASGPLWGTALRRAGRALGDGPGFEAPQLVRALEAALAGVVDLGGARPGDKTMVDALAPAVAALQGAVARGEPLAAALRAATAAAEAGVRATVPMQARKGRASYLGGRSVGHQDAGATSAALVVRALEQAVDR